MKAHTLAAVLALFAAFAGPAEAETRAADVCVGRRVLCACTALNVITYRLFPGNQEISGMMQVLSDALAARLGRPLTEEDGPYMLAAMVVEFAPQNSSPAHRRHVTETCIRLAVATGYRPQ